MREHKIIFFFVTIFTFIQSIYTIEDITDIRNHQRRLIFRGDLHNNANPNNWPYITVVTVGRFVLCSGVLIRPKYVMSSANCFKKNETILPDKFGPLSVRVGPAPVTYMDWNLVSIENLDFKQIVPTVLEDDLISIVRYIVHPHYFPHDVSQLHRNDIGIGQLLREAGELVAPLPMQPVDTNLTCRTATYRSMLPTEDQSNNTDIGALREFIGSPFELLRCINVLKLLGNRTHAVPELNLEGKFCISFGNVSRLEELRDFGMIGAPVICEDGLQGISSVLTVQTIKSAITFHQYVEVYTDFLAHLGWIQKTLNHLGDTGFDLDGQNKYRSGTMVARSITTNLFSFFHLVHIALTIILTKMFV